MQNRIGSLSYSEEVMRLSKLDYVRFFEMANLINRDSVDLCRLRTHFPCRCYIVDENYIPRSETTCVIPHLSHVRARKGQQLLFRCPKKACDLNR